MWEQTPAPRGAPAGVLQPGPTACASPPRRPELSPVRLYDCTTGIPARRCFRCSALTPQLGAVSAARRLCCTGGEECSGRNAQATTEAREGGAIVPDCSPQERPLWAVACTTGVPGRRCCRCQALFPLPGVFAAPGGVLGQECPSYSDNRTEAPGYLDRDGPAVPAVICRVITRPPGWRTAAGAAGVCGIQSVW